MAELVTLSQTSLLLVPRLRLQAASWQQQKSVAYYQSLCTTRFLATRPLSSLPISSQRKHSFWGIKAGVTSDTKVTTSFTVNKDVESIDILPDSGGSGDNFGAAGGSGGGGGGGGGNGDSNDKEGSGESDDHNKGNKKNRAILMSQRFTLFYALLVGVGGVAGYLKSGSQKSLMAGAFSASLLYYVYTQLPSHPVLASSIGLGCSAALLAVMGSRFKKSGKIFPAGVVSFVSLVMTGGYLHGIMRSMH